MRKLFIRGLAMALALASASQGLAEETPKPADPASRSDGTVAVPAFSLPLSTYLSPEARALLQAGTKSPVGDTPPPAQAIPGIRAGMRKGLAPLVEALRAQYGVVLEETVVGGIKGYWVRPANAARRGRRPVLLNLPAGGFMIAQANPIGLIEAIPVAALGGFDVLTIDYRQYPEAVFPAASEDVAKVYRELLKANRPEHIGIYGCSAGGLLTAQALALFDQQRLPMPGAAGILCASADGLWGGDSWYWQNPIQGKPAPPKVDEERYYAGHNPADPLLSPMVSDALLARFPPTLLVSATRAGELSSTVNTHRLLVRAGVDADLHVWDGFGHAFMFLQPQLAELREVHKVIADFFVKHLNRRSRK